MPSSLTKLGRDLHQLVLAIERDGAYRELRRAQGGKGKGGGTEIRFAWCVH